MGDRRRGHEIRKLETRPCAAPNLRRMQEPIGIDHFGNFAPSFRVGARTRRLNKAPSNSTHWHMTAGHTPSPGADSDSFSSRLHESVKFYF